MMKFNFSIIQNIGRGSELWVWRKIISGKEKKWLCVNCQKYPFCVVGHLYYEQHICYLYNFVLLLGTANLCLGMDLLEGIIVPVHEERTIPTLRPQIPIDRKTKSHEFLVNFLLIGLWKKIPQWPLQG